jgi:hypothetical protein
LNFWLEQSGHRIFVSPVGVLVGRDACCDVVLLAPQISRRHALLRATDDGLELLTFGRHPTRLNGAPCAPSVWVQFGDEIDFCGQVFRVVPGAAPRGSEPDVSWGIECRAGVLFPLSEQTVRVGGSASDDLVVVGWEPSVFLIHRVANGVVLEAMKDAIVRGVPLPAGECVTLASGDRIAYMGQSLKVIALPGDATTITETMLGADLATGVELLFLPRGGRLTVRYGSRVCAVYLPERRCDLIASLLRPGTNLACGDPIPVAVLVERIWPGGNQTRIDLNTLIFRTRKDLLRSEIDGATLIERTGGGVRLRLAAGAPVVIG